MRVLITGGGTAGHVNPALSIADAILERDKSAIIEYVGTEKGIESKLVRKRGMPLHLIEVYGLKRSLSPSNIKALWKALSAQRQCKGLIREFHPDVVIGTGGYVCWPLISAAAAMKIPTVLHEANVHPGFAVKTLQAKADLILVNFEETRALLTKAKNRVLRVGMPVNRAFYRIAKTRSVNAFSNGDAQPFHILSFGGSLGARQLNLAVLELMRTYLKERPHITIEHACGAREFDTVKAMFEKAGLNACPNIRLSEYIYDMPEKMANADLVISRSGASTLAELAAAEKASVLIPSPNVTGDQQRKNARAFERKNAAVVVEDCDAVTALPKVVADLVEEKGRSTIRTMQKNARHFAVEACDSMVYHAIRELIGTENKEC